MLMLLASTLAGLAGAEDIEPDGAEGTIYFKPDSTVNDVITHTAFGTFGRFVLPLEWGYDENMPLSRVSTLLPYHSNIDTNEAVNTLNYMVDVAATGGLAFFDIYTDEQKNADTTKESTGLFYFKGEPGMPYAIVCAGGGFSYVGSVHESFPHAIEISGRGYNAFTIQYRTGGADKACEDLAAAITFIFNHADELGVNTDDYSLWGGSAGARMAAYLGSYGSAAFGGDSLPRPATVIMAYTGHSDYTPSDPPTFVIIGERDGVASPQAMEQRVQALQAIGVDAEFHLYPNVGHGFGMGTGTSAEGWVSKAIDFWEKHIN